MKKRFKGAVLRSESDTKEGMIAIVIDPDDPCEDRPVVGIRQSVTGYQALCALFDNYPEDQELRASFEAECPDDPGKYCSGTIVSTIVFVP